MIVVALIWVIGVIGLTFYWSREIGVARAFMAGICRAAWTLPLILSLFPETVTRRIPGTVALQPVHILVDDSDSVKLPDYNGSSSRSAIKEILKRIDDVCIQFGCMPKVSMLSDLAGETKKGFTPLSRVIEPWLYKTGGEPWMILSDGGDFRPSVSWDERLRDRGSEVSQRQSLASRTMSGTRKTNGLVVSFGKPRTPGFSVESVNMAPLAFEGKTAKVSAGIERFDGSSAGAQRVQVQVSLDGKIVTSGEAEFAAGSSEAPVDLTFAAPKRGPHIVTVKALPVAGELDTWDNAQTRVLDVMPNTVGVLHLLGSPAWDGRFMRRFLKAEPKFDVISFFILRDPWDSQLVSEREMSLIPFPVERLFKEELVNFRVIVMQNFTLMRFLQPEYQENLAKFVKDGGGLLFIGGPRALTETDVTSSSLSGLLPFTMTAGAVAQGDAAAADAAVDDAFGGMGSTYDSEAPYTIEMAAPDASRRALANVYDGWQELGARLSLPRGMKGMHAMNSVKFRENEITPLLNARMKDGKVVPLAVASYPGKGRALWVFSDSLWRLAMSSNPMNARSDYHMFMDTALSWLTRGDMRGALTVRDLKVIPSGEASDKIKWHAVFSGSAARYLKSATSVRLNVCGVNAAPDSFSFGGAAGDAVSADGEIAATLRDGSLCALKLDVEHPSFGSLTVTGWTLIPETLDDGNMGPSPAKLKQLATLTGATFAPADGERGRLIESWLQSWGAANGKALPDKMKSTREFYWPQEFSWLWVALLFIPAEVILRRWHLISGQAIRKVDETEDARDE